MECLLPYLCMVTVPHIIVGLERMLDYRGVGLARFTVHSTTYIGTSLHGYIGIIHVLCCGVVFHSSEVEEYMCSRTLVLQAVFPPEKNKGGGVTMNV